jgi:hypothetical protein
MDTLNLEIEANSPYNDGWTQQFYKDELKKVKTKKNEPKIHPKRAEVAEANADALFADGFDDAISGFDAAGGCAVYDYNKCLKVLCDRDEMSREEAHEYMEFNVVGAYVGDFTPIFVHSL